MVSYEIGSVLVVERRNPCHSYPKMLLKVRADNTGRKEGNVLFNDALNTFYLRLYGVRIWLRTIPIVRKETRYRHIGYSFRLTARVLLYAQSTDRIAHTTVFVTPVVEHWLEREIAQWVHPMKDRSDDPSHHKRTLLPQSYISLQTIQITLVWYSNALLKLKQRKEESKTAKYKSCMKDITANHSITSNNLQ